MNEKVMKIVESICNTTTNCRGILNNEQYINSLLELKGIDANEVDIYEMPVNWNNQVVILYKVKLTNEHRELFAGIGTDGKFYFEDEAQDDIKV